MIEKTIENKLDLLLLYLKNYQLEIVSFNKPERGVLDIQERERTNNVDFSSREICIDKLIKDGYVSNENSTNEKYYVKITVEGLLFCSAGGYTKKKRKSIIKTNNKLLQNWAISIGTLLAGLYALFQIFQSLVCDC